MKKNSKGLLSVAFGFMSLAFVGCDGRTTESLCLNPSGPIEGITGSYELSFRDQETWGVKTASVNIMPDGKSLTYKIRGEDKDSHTTICNAGGQYVFETRDENAQLFTQGRFYVSQVGLHFQPIMYDKTSLDAAGIPTKITVIPDKFRKFMGEQWSNRLDGVALKAMEVFDQEDAAVLVVDNKDISPTMLLQHSKPLFLGFTLFRK